MLVGIDVCHSRQFNASAVGFVAILLCQDKVHYFSKAEYQKKGQELLQNPYEVCFSYLLYLHLFILF